MYYFKKNFRCGILSIGLLLGASSSAFASSSLFSILFGRPYSSTTEVLIPIQDVERFLGVVKQVKGHYVDPVSNEKIFESAVRGVLSKLDPHSTYLDAEELKELTAVTIGEFGGVGIAFKGAPRTITAHSTHFLTLFGCILAWPREVASGYFFVVRAG